MRGPCAGCAAGDHHLCWIAYCYGCKDPYHGRKPGGMGLNKATVVEGHRLNLKTGAVPFGRITTPEGEDYDKGEKTVKKYGSSFRFNYDLT